MSEVNRQSDEWLGWTPSPGLKRAIFVMPVLFIGALLFVKYGVPARYPRLIKEDGVLEYTQALCYGAAGLVAFATSTRFLSAGRRVLAILYLVFAAGLLFVAMEEVSWGQRLAGVETPELLKQWNVQEEISVHNLKPLQEFLHAGYIMVGFVAGLTWAFVPGAAWAWREGLPRYVLPGSLTMLYFLPVAAFYLSLELFPGGGAFPSQDQEIFETPFAAGFLVFSVSVYLSARLPRKAN
jgi:hypothetical protein